MKTLLVTLGLFVLFLGMVAMGGFLWLVEPGPEGYLAYAGDRVTLALHRHGLAEGLSEKQTKLLYEKSCTRQCHSREVVENNPKTAMEWEWIVTRMGALDRADLTPPQAEGIIGYLQKHFLSNIPTMLPENIMRFLKSHLWKMDFGDEDLYFDVIHLPTIHRSLIRYLLLQTPEKMGDGPLFVIYFNTHSGIVPNWDLAKITSIDYGDGKPIQATEWQMLYEDVQRHHRQGILTFPLEAAEKARTANGAELIIQPPSMRPRRYYWKLPVPPFEEEP
ncbi:MAG: hypothetical protein HQL52_11775 [Magnetococcales bacterium]|nr:hypothetical protein [Magnetococcales bacterium]